MMYASGKVGAVTVKCDCLGSHSAANAGADKERTMTTESNSEKIFFIKTSFSFGVGSGK